jgi:hypothetical protein
MTDTATVATTLAVRKAIDRQLDDLIRAAAEKVKKLKGADMRQNQIRNVVNVANATESTEAVTNFIRYQIGRDSRWRDFGKAVIADIETGAVSAALKAVKEAVPQADLTSTRAELTALYLGYLNRCFVYADNTDDWDDLSAKLAD